MIQLTEVQQDAVKADSKHILIKGIPGSGKTLVLQEKVKHVLKNNPEAKILIITYNNTLKNYMEESLEQDEVMNIEVKTYHSWALTMLRQAIPNFKLKTFSKTINEIFQDVYKELEKNHLSHRFWTQKNLKGFLKEEYDWIQEKGIKGEEEYLEVSRTGRGTALQRSDRKIVMEYLEKVDAELDKKRCLPFPTYGKLLNQHIEGAKEAFEYDAIFIDEAQDLSQMQLITLRKMAEGGQLIVAADLGQKIYKTDFTWRSVGIKIAGGRTKNLNIPHRSTKETMNLALSLLKNDPLIKEEEDLVSTDEMRVSGKLPLVVESKNSSVETTASIIKKIQQENDEDLTIGVLLNMNRDLNRYDKNLPLYGVQAEKIDRKSGSVLKPGVKLITMHGAKGLEFDVVIVTELDESFPSTWGVVEGEEENSLQSNRRLLYVSMTRARGALYLVYEDTPSRYIDELDESMYEFIKY